METKNLKLIARTDDDLRVISAHLQDSIADIKNIGGRYAGATTAAEFIHCFTNDVTWAHLDIAGTSISSLKNDINTSWASGFGVRLLNKYLEEFIEK